MSNTPQNKAIEGEVKTIVSGLTLQERRNMLRTYQVMKEYGREACLKAMDILDETPRFQTKNFGQKLQQASTKSWNGKLA